MKKAVGCTLFLSGLILLLGLGTWQIQRAEWKRGVLDRLDFEYAKDASSYQFQPGDLMPEGEQAYHLVRGIIRGEFIKDYIMYWPRPRESNYALLTMAPLKLQSGQILMVFYDHVYGDLRTQKPVHSVTVPEGKLRIIGLVRYHDSSFMALENMPEKNLWYRFNTEEIEDFFNLENILPVVLFAETITNSEGESVTDDLQVEKIIPNNNHIQYAVFWYILAAAWATIFGYRVFRQNY